MRQRHAAFPWEVISVCGDGGQVNGVDVPGSVTEALRMGDAFADYLNSPATAELDGAACGEVLIALGEIQAKLAAAHATLLRRFEPLTRMMPTVTAPPRRGWRRRAG